MQYDVILVRFGELSTKGKNKKDFITILFRNIKRVLHEFSHLTYEKVHDRIYIYLNGFMDEKIIQLLEDVSGIQSFSFVKKVEKNMDLIKNTALELAINETIGSFKVDTRRADKTFEFASNEVNRKIAGVILENTQHHVDIHNPDFYLRVEIRQQGAFLYTKIIPGAGGFPLGVAGKALLLLSGGIDSPVAGYYMMKKGVVIEAIHFASPPYTSEGARQKVIDLLEKLAHIQGEIKLHMIPFTALQERIYENKDQSYAITLMRRMMIRISEKIAEKSKCLVLASGESIGQVASQTLHSMQVINEVTTMPIIRPLAVMDKLEIIKVAIKIQTYEISIRPFIDCCTIFNPENPVTKPTLKRAKALESEFDFDSLLQNCVDQEEVLFIKPNIVSKKIEEFL